MVKMIGSSTGVSFILVLPQYIALFIYLFIYFIFLKFYFIYTAGSY